MGVRTNADTPEDARVARGFGAEGIGLFRTEHMFYGKGCDEPLFLLRKMILSRTVDERQAALDELFPFVKRDIKATLEAMDGLPVTIRLLDPPLHEFVPQDKAAQAELAEPPGHPAGGHPQARRGPARDQPHDGPPRRPPGHHLSRGDRDAGPRDLRGGRRADPGDGKDARPEIMVPVTCDVKELDATKVDRRPRPRGGRRADGRRREVPLRHDDRDPAGGCLLADRMAKSAEFFSFGTNDLTQMTFGFSRDDIGGFLPDYLKDNILPADPFQTIDQEGVGQLIQHGGREGPRRARGDLKIGICGEQGGDPASVEFCFKSGLNYVSCSPYRVPIARLAAAHAAIKAKKK